MQLPFIRILVPPHCEPGMPLLGVHQLCGYAESLGVSTDVVDLSVLLKNPEKMVLEESDFRDQGSYWRRIAHARDVFCWNYKHEAPYAIPSWDSADINCFRWNYFLDQTNFIERYSEDKKVVAFYDRVLTTERIPDVYFISVMFPSQFLDALIVATYIRQRWSSAKIVIGGGLISSLIVSPDDIEGPLADLFDAISIGEGEFLIYAMSRAPLAEIISRFGKTTSGKRAVLLLSEKLKQCIDREISVPSPLYVFDKREQYLTHKEVLPYRIMAGCYWNRCKFCTEWTYKSLLKPVPILEHVRRLKCFSQYAGGVVFQDSALHPDALFDLSCKIIEHIQKKDFHWGINARFDARLTREVLSKMFEAGCCFIRFGLESGSPRILESMAKGINLATARRILKDTRELGILTHLYCIVGFDGETDKDRMETSRFLLDEEVFPDSFSISQYIPYYASRGNFHGCIAHNTGERWSLSETRVEDSSVTDFIQETESSFSQRHPLHRTLASPAHTIGSFGLIREWRQA